MTINIIKEYVQKCGDELNNALRHPVFNPFEEKDSQEVCNYLVEGIKNLELKDQLSDWVFLELTGNIINSETNKVIFKNRKMIFCANVRENIDDSDRFCFLGFEDKFVLR